MFVTCVISVHMQHVLPVKLNHLTQIDNYEINQEHSFFPRNGKHSFCSFNRKCNNITEYLLFPLSNYVCGLTSLQTIRRIVI